MSATAPQAQERLWEVDAARTAAIVMMIVYHAVYDVATLAPQTGVDAFSGGWRVLQVVTGSSFLLILGVSLMIANGRARARGQTGATLYRRHARRALQVLAAGLVVSVATYLTLGDEYVRFGILQCIGISMLAAPFFIRLGLVNIPLGLVAIWTGLWLQDQTFDMGWLFALGLRPDGELGVDYYPMLPWFGVALIGLAVGHMLYPDGRRGGPMRRVAARGGPLRDTIGAPGRKSLPIYLVHQLILFPLVALGLIGIGEDIDLNNL